MKDTQTYTTLSSVRLTAGNLMLRLIGILGFITAGIGAGDFDWTKTLAPALGENLVTIGLLAAAADKGLRWLGDLLDNGKMDGSFLVPLLALCCALGLTSCANLGLGVSLPDKDGCYGLTSSHEGRSYTFGPCSNETGAVYQWRAVWVNRDGVTIRATKKGADLFAASPWKLAYLPKGGTIWILYDSAKGGISLDGIPPQVDISAT